MTPHQFTDFWSEAGRFSVRILRNNVRKKTDPVSAVDSLSLPDFEYLLCGEAMGFTVYLLPGLFAGAFE